MKARQQRWIVVGAIAAVAIILAIIVGVSTERHEAHVAHVVAVHQAEVRKAEERQEVATEQAEQQQQVDQAKREAQEAKTKAKEAEEKAAETKTQYVPVPAPNTGSWTEATRQAYINKLEAAGVSSTVAICVESGIESHYSEAEKESLHPTSSLSEQPQAVQEVDESCEYR